MNQDFFLMDIPIEIIDKINKINWSEYETAYGNAEKTIPFYLIKLFGKDTKIAMDASHQLWSSLCHQHAYISSAALPAYDILKNALLNLDDKLKIEILDIFTGFSICTNNDYYIAINHTPQNWEQELKQKLIADIVLFQELSKHREEDVSDFARGI